MTFSDRMLFTNPLIHFILISIFTVSTLHPTHVSEVVEIGAYKSGVDRQVSFLSAHTVDILIEFSKPTTEALVLHANGIFDTVAEFDEWGMIIDD